MTGLPFPENAVIVADTAFLVLMFHDGEVLVSPDLDEVLELDRQAHQHDVIGMCSAVQRKDDPHLGIPADRFALLTAFIVYRLPEGEVTVTTDVNALVVPDRAPHFDDIQGMCEAAVRNVSSRRSSSD